MSKQSINNLTVFIIARKCFSVYLTIFSKNIIVRGTKFEPLAKEGPLNLFEINDGTRMVREPLEDRMSFLHALNIRGINSRAK